MAHRRSLYSDRGEAGNIIAMLLGGAAAGGLLLGALLGLFGGLDLVGEPARVASAATASYYDCPDGDPLGTVTRGDRVFITARDESGAWVQVRSPRAVSARAWMRSIHVLPDSAIDDFPVLSCAVPVTAVVALPTTTVAETTTTTEAPEETTTTSTSSTTTTSTTTTTTTVALPSVGGVSANPAPIWETYFVNFGQLTCNLNPGQPSQSTVSASVSAAAGVQSVTMSWQVDGVSGSTAMSQSGGQWQATLGPFDAENPNVVPQNGSLPISVTVTVIDGLGRSTSGQTTVTLNDCTFG